MTDFAAAYTPLSLGFAGRERREVIVEHELLGALLEHFISLLHVKFCSEGYGCERLSLATGEDGRTMGARKYADLAPDRAHLIGAASVNPPALIENEIAEGLPLLMGDVTVDHHLLGLLVLFGEGGYEVALDLLESGLTLLLRLRGLSEIVEFLVYGFMNGLLEVLILLIVRIIPLDVLSEILVELLLDAALFLDGLVCELYSLEHYILRHLVHLTLNHHDVLLGGCDHEIEVGVRHFREVRVNLEFSVYSGHPYFGDRSEERNVAGRKGCGSGEAGEGIWLDVLLGGDEPYVYEYCEVEIVREQRPEGSVYKPGNENFIVVSLSFPLHESARESSCGIVLFFVVDLKREEISLLVSFFRASYRSEKHCASHFDDGRSVGLLRHLAGLNLDCPTIGQYDLLCDDIHYSVDL